MIVIYCHLIINPSTAKTSTVFGHKVHYRGQSVTQRSMGREAPKYPAPQCQVVNEKVKFS